MKQGFVYWTKRDGWLLGGPEWLCGEKREALHIVELSPLGKSKVLRTAPSLEEAGCNSQVYPDDHAANVALKEEHDTMTTIAGLLARVNELDEQIAALRIRADSVAHLETVLARRLDKLKDI